MLTTLFFYFFALLVVGGAVLTVTLRSAVHCAIALIASLAGVAGLFLLAQAEFLFAVQIILYVGGIMVLFLFVIMLVNLDQAAKEKQFNRQGLIAIALVAVIGGQTAYLLTKGLGVFRLPPPVPEAATQGNTELLAGALFSEYLLPFELASLLLVVAIVGSVVMAKKRI